MVALSPGIGSSVQIRAVLSSDAVTMRRPSGLNAAEKSLRFMAIEFDDELPIRRILDPRDAIGACSYHP